MFLELTGNDTLQQKVLVNADNIVFIWEGSEVTSIFTSESAISFSVKEPYATIKFMLGMKGVTIETPKND